MFENKIGKLNEELREKFNVVFAKCDKNDVDAYIEEQQIEPDKLDSMWLSVNRKKRRDYFKRKWSKYRVFEIKNIRSKIAKTHILHV